MPHNLYLHTATVQNKKVVRRNDVVKQAVWYCSIEPIFPIFLSFFVNVAVVSIAAERVYGTPNASSVGLTDFCNYFYSLKGGCLMWGIALLAAGQSSAITVRSLPGNVLFNNAECICFLIFDLSPFLKKKKLDHLYRPVHHGWIS